MKRLIYVLGGLLVLPAFADVTPDVGNVANTPVAQPSRATPNANNATSRATARVSASATNTQKPRATTERTSQSSRNATVARSGAATTTVARGASETTSRVASRVASRPSRNVATTGTNVTSRRAMPTNANPSVTSRVGMTTATVANRVSSRASNAVMARAPTTISVSAPVATAEEQIVTTTEEKQTAVSNMDEIVQLTDYCKAQYTSCMDNFCNVLDDNQGRCSCSKNIKNYEKTENALKLATEALQDVSQQIQYIGLTKDDIETLFTQTEAEAAMQSTTDSTQLKNDLDNIKDMIIGVKTGTASSYETSGMSFDLSGLLDFNIDSTGFDLTALFGGSNTNTNSISNQRGDQLYKTAAARCKASVLNTCQAQGVDITVITNSYDLEIDKQCIAYERALTDSNENMNRTVRNAKVVLQKARLMVAQQKNAYDLRGCVNALDSCMQDDFVCGTDYENCLDPTGKYIVNGEVVIGSSPGYPIKDDDSTKPGAAPTQHDKGLYATWGYDTDNNAWIADGRLTDYINTYVTGNTVTENSENLAEYLQYKIGYIDDANKAYGMCSSVLTKCQNYTYTDKSKYNPNNQVIKEYLQRTLTQIKVAQDEIISSYAENCISDVSSCLSTNQYDSTNPDSSKSYYAINACKAQIVTCMSVNGDATDDPKPAYIKEWVQKMQEVTGTKDQQTYKEPVNSNTLCIQTGGIWNGVTCACPAGFSYYTEYGCVKDCLKLTLSCDTYSCVGHIQDIYIKPGNSTVYSDSRCTSVLATLPIPTDSETGGQCDLLAFNDGPICADNWDSDDLPKDKLFFRLDECLGGYMFGGKPKDLYHETDLYYRCYSQCLVGYQKVDNKCVFQ